MRRSTLDHNSDRPACRYSRYGHRSVQRAETPLHHQPSITARQWDQTRCPRSERHHALHLCSLPRVVRSSRYWGNRVSSIVPIWPPRPITLKNALSRGPIVPRTRLTIKVPSNVKNCLRWDDGGPNGGPDQSLTLTVIFIAMVNHTTTGTRLPIAYKTGPLDTVPTHAPSEPYPAFARHRPQLKKNDRQGQP